MPRNFGRPGILSIFDNSGKADSCSVLPRIQTPRLSGLGDSRPRPALPDPTSCGSFGVWAPSVPLCNSFKYSCTNWTAIAPSPTAEATRLTDPDRTSPAANTPGRLVSSRNGCRRPVQWADCARAGPGPDEPLVVPLDLRGQPVGPRHRPDEAEQRRGRQRPHLPRLVVDELDRAEVAVAGHPPDLRVAEHLDVGRLLDPPGQVARTCSCTGRRRGSRGTPCGPARRGRRRPGRRSCRRRRPPPPTPGTSAPRWASRRSRRRTPRTARTPRRPAGGSRPRWRSAGTWP